MDGEASRVIGQWESAAGAWIGAIGSGIDAFGVLVIVLGIAWATGLFLRRRMDEAHYGAYRTRVGRALLLGLEVLVAADIVKTIAIDPTFGGLGVLAGLVLIRTFLSWSLVLEIEGRWPWQPATRAADAASGSRATVLDGAGARMTDVDGQRGSDAQPGNGAASTIASATGPAPSSDAMA